MENEYEYVVVDRRPIIGFWSVVVVCSTVVTLARIFAGKN